MDSCSKHIRRFLAWFWEEGLFLGQGVCVLNLGWWLAPLEPFRHPFDGPGCSRKRGQPTAQPDLNPSSYRSHNFAWVEGSEGGIKFNCDAIYSCRGVHWHSRVLREGRKQAASCGVTISKVRWNVCKGFLNQGCPVVHSGLCVGLSVVGWFPS